MFVNSALDSGLQEKGKTEVMRNPQLCYARNKGGIIKVDPLVAGLHTVNMVSFLRKRLDHGLLSRSGGKVQVFRQKRNSRVRIRASSEAHAFKMRGGKPSGPCSWEIIWRTLHEENTGVGIGSVLGGWGMRCEII